MSDGKFKFRCKHCDNKLKAPVELIGERIRCPHCNKPIAIPDPADNPPTTSSRQIRGLGTESQKIKKMDSSNSAIRKADTRRQEKLDTNLHEDETDAVPREQQTTTSKAIEECTPADKTKSKAPKKKITMGATKSVKLTSSQKRLIKPKKSFKIKKKK